MKPRKTEHPILFSTPMVQAILEGRKTMTRRMNNLKLINQNPDHWHISETWISLDGNETIHKIFANSQNGEIKIIKNPFGNPGDKLWVREKFNINTVPTGYPYHYYADNDVFTDKDSERWKPSIHMPKSAARIWLEITDVRVMQLQYISKSDAKNEGVTPLLMSSTQIIQYGQLYQNYLKPVGRFNDGVCAISSFYSLWCKINGEESFKSNPWVWVIEFKRIEQ